MVEKLELLLDDLKKVLSELKKVEKEETPAPSTPSAPAPPLPIVSPETPTAPESLPTEEFFQIGLLFPPGKFDLRDKFNNNLSDAIKKVTTKDFLPKIVFEQELDLQPTTEIMWDEITKNFVQKKIDACVLICSDKYDFVTTQKKFVDSGIFFQAFTLSQLDRKIPYLDFLIELMLFKEK